ncbi:MAG TPA: hypothetical protein VMR52_05955 [Dehalococcoidia bacterium]|nr:hypothetical protein [Dehalococcoidia bacterium]
MADSDRLGRRRGAPKGNKNAVKTGQRSTDSSFRSFVQSLSPEQLKLAGGSVRRAYLEAQNHAQLNAEDETSSVPDASIVQSIRSDASLDTPHHTVTKQVDSSSRLSTVVNRLREIYTMGAEAFVRNHWPVVAVIERLLDDLEQIKEANPQELEGVRSEAALIRSSFHEEIKRETNDFSFCPYCTWRKEREPGRQSQRNRVI